MMQLWIRQIGAVLRLEMKKTFFSKRGWWIYCLAAAPVATTVLHWLLLSGARRSFSGHHVGDDSIIFAGLFQFFYLHATIFFGCMGIFSNLFRGEMLEKTLHYYFLTPMRRELLVIGKFLAGLSVALVLFVGSTAAAFLTLGRHFGPAWSDYLYHGPGLSQLGSYTLIRGAWLCGIWRQVFLMCGLLFRNPMIPAAVVFVWEESQPVPARRYSRRLSVIFYLRSLCPPWKCRCRRPSR